MPILAISVLGYFPRLNFDIDRLSKFPLDCPSKLPGVSGHEQICHGREREREMLQGSSKTGIESRGRKNVQSGDMKVGIESVERTLIPARILHSAFFCPHPIIKKRGEFLR